MWTINFVAYCTPHRWTSVERVLYETSFRALWPVAQMFNSFASVNGLLPVCKEEMLPIEPPPPVVYIDNDTPLDVAYETLLSAYNKQDTIVLWKNFSGGLTDKWKNEEFAKKHLNMEASYEFGRNLTSHLNVELPLAKAWPNLEDLYLGFSYKFLEDNKELYADLKDAVFSKSSKISKLIPWETSMHHSFLYKGKKYSTGLHNAPVSDWFFQIANGKKWRFVHPNYAPYLRPVTLDGISMISYYDHVSDDTRIPYIDITSDAGDFMFFPRHWWHHVTNVHEGIGIGVGFRPKEEIPSNIIQAFFPFLVPYKAYAFHRVVFTLGLAKRFYKSVVLGITSTIGGRSGLGSRTRVFCYVLENMNKYTPRWGYNVLSEQYGAPVGPCDTFPKDIMEWSSDEL